MSAQRYERISPNDDDDYHQNTMRSPTSAAVINTTTHNSPPPSFRSRASSTSSTNPTTLSHERDRLVSPADRTLAETFESPSDDESDNEQGASHQLDDRQRVMSGRPDDGADARGAQQQATGGVERRVTQLPAPGGRVYGGGNAANDGVFANMSAKPERGEDVDEKPPTYEQAAADATPPYWETTILTPPGSSPDDVFIDGLPVGSFFSFVWNGMISMSFQLVGFLLTYLLHTSHAAKNGSKAGLGITLIQYGFSMKRDFSKHRAPSPGPGGDDQFVPPPDDPNSHDFDPNAGDADFVQGGAADGHDPAMPGAVAGIKATDWFAYALMIIGWFLVIRSVSEYVRARRHEQLVLTSPSRGLNVPVVAEGEAAEGSV